MEAKEFLKEAKRMCQYYLNVRNIGCSGCPAYQLHCEIPERIEPEFVEIVEKWSKEHPIITNRTKIEQTIGREIVVNENDIRIKGVIPTNYHLNYWLDQEYVAPQEVSHDN